MAQSVAISTTPKNLSSDLRFTAEGKYIVQNVDSRGGGELYIGLYSGNGSALNTGSPALRLFYGERLEITGDGSRNWWAWNKLGDGEIIVERTE